MIYRFGFTPINLLPVMCEAIRSLNMKLRSSKDHTQALLSLLSLTLKVLSVYIKSSQESNESSDMCIKNKTKVLDLLKKVVNAQIKKVIGGTVFGGESTHSSYTQWHYYGSELVKASEELKVIMMFVYTCLLYLYYRHGIILF